MSFNNKNFKWVFEALDKPNNVYNSTRADNKNSYVKECNRLKYCIKCKLVWEVTYNGVVLHHKDLPTYGVKRQKCRRCNDKNKNKEK